MYAESVPSNQKVLNPVLIEAKNKVSEVSVKHPSLPSESNVLLVIVPMWLQSGHPQEGFASIDRLWHPAPRDR